MRDGRRAEAAVLDRLQAALAHRGPDGHGRHLEGPVGLLNTRLAIIDLQTGDQPFYDPQGAVLVANGEIYNDPELRKRFPDAPFNTGSDCESPLHLYRRKGLDFVDDLRGMYAIAIYDPATSKLILTRDPFGIKPLYYVETSECFAFASEAQALIAAGLADRQIRPQPRAELFQLKFSTGPNTIFSQIHRMLPGETLVVSNGQTIERRRRRALPEGGPLEVTYDQAFQKLDEILRDSAAHHLRSDVPYGLFLSGGIDSSTVLALMAQLSPKPVVALTVGFPGSRAADERAAAERIARSVGADHHMIEMTENDFWNYAPRVAAAHDDPTTDPATLPTFLLAKAVKSLVTVVLTGEGGDEMFCGYSRYRRASWFGGAFSRHARTRGECDGLADDAMSGWRDGLARAEREEALPGRTFIQRLQAADCAEWLPNDLLTKIDRCMMAHGVEGRTPFLDPVVSQFAFLLPDQLKATTRMSKRLLRDWVAKNIPAAEPYAKKKGFNPPIGEWIAAKKTLVTRMVAEQPGIAEMFSHQEVQRAFADPANRAQPAWSMIFYALWHSHHVLSVPAEGTIEDVLAGARGLG